MKNTINSIVVSVIVVAIAVGTFLSFYTPTTKTVVKGMDFENSPYITVNGINTWYTKQTMRQATTTLCAIKAPVSTSTINSVAFTIVTGTSTAASIDIATSTTAFSTTTNLVSAISVASGKQASAVWNPIAGNSSVISPDQWVVIKTAGAGQSGYKFGGYCNAVFTEI